jgi:hypothetical protein
VKITINQGRATKAEIAPAAPASHTGAPSPTALPPAAASTTVPASTTKPSRDRRSPPTARPPGIPPATDVSSQTLPTDCPPAARSDATPAITSKRCPAASSGRTAGAVPGLVSAPQRAASPVRPLSRAGPARRLGGPTKGPSLYDVGGSRLDIAGAARTRQGRTSSLRCGRSTLTEPVRSPGVGSYRERGTSCPRRANRTGRSGWPGVGTCPAPAHPMTPNAWLSLALASHSSRCVRPAPELCSTHQRQAPTRRGFSRMASDKAAGSLMFGTLVQLGFFRTLGQDVS